MWEGQHSSNNDQSRPNRRTFSPVTGNYQKDSTTKIWVRTLFLDLISGFYPIFNALKSIYYNKSFILFCIKIFKIMIFLFFELGCWIVRRRIKYECMQSNLIPLRALLCIEQCMFKHYIKLITFFYGKLYKTCTFFWYKDEFLVFSCFFFWNITKN